MRGQAPLIAMRQRGKVPSLVILDTDPDATRGWRDWHELTPEIAHVQADPEDGAHRADLRFVVGLTVQVCGTDPARVEAFGRACAENGAARTITSTSLYFGHVEVTDTLEAF